MSTPLKTVIAEMNARFVGRLANDADCREPNGDSAGIRFLISVRDAVAELLDNLDADEVIRLKDDPTDIGWLDDDGRLHEIADNAPDIATHTMWSEFVDLGAYREDASDYGIAFSDLEQSAKVSLFIIAERLAWALLTTAAERLAALTASLDQTIRDAACKRGREDGLAAASWVEIDERNAQTILTGIDDGDPVIMDELPSADLSGRWADGLLPRDLMAEVLASVDAEVPEDDDERAELETMICDEYETAYNDAVGAEVDRRCRVYSSDPRS